jgi:hypothetical protein
MANAVAMEAASRVINRQIFDRLKLIATGQDTGEVAPAEEPSSDNAQSETEEAAEEATVQTDDKETEG